MNNTSPTLRALKTLGLLATVTGVPISACTDEPLDLRPTLTAGSSGKASNATAGGGSGGATGATSSDGGGTTDPAGGEGGMQEGGMGVGGTSGGKGGAGGSGGKGGAGSSGGGTGGSIATCGNGKQDGTEECDDGNKLSGDGCSFDCKSKCEECEKTCQALWEANGKTIANAYVDGYSLEGNAEGGPASGVPRITLFRDLMQCIYESHCNSVFLSEVGGNLSQATASFRNCSCANPLPDVPPNVVPPECTYEDSVIKGPCYRQMLEAAEADSLKQMYDRISRRAFAIGQAFYLVQNCDARLCALECMPVEAAACRDANGDQCKPPSTCETNEACASTCCKDHLCRPADSCN
jgi:cysteine-rich repeat protein